MEAVERVVEEEGARGGAVVVVKGEALAAVVKGT